MPPEDPDDYADRIIQELTPDEYADQEIAGLAAESPEVAHAAAPPPRPLQQAFADKPWHEQFSDVVRDTPLGGVVGTALDKYRNIKSAAPSAIGTALENAADTAIASTTDEGAANLLTGGGLSEDLLSAFPPSARPTYAAGSQFEDNRRTLEQEKLERDAVNPGSALGGKIAGGIAQGLAIPGGAAAQAVGSTGLAAASMLGEGHGDLGERADQALDTAAEHPFRTALALGAPLVAGPVAKVAGKAKDALTRSANRNTVAAFTTPAQRAAIVDNSSLPGNQAVEKLGGDVRAQGLHKQPWYKFLIPPNATTFAENATAARQAGEQALTAAENKIMAAGDPAVQYTPIAEDLEGAAAEVSKRVDKAAAVPEANFMRKQAQDLRDAGTLPVEGPTQAFYEDAPFTSKGGPRNFVAESQVPTDPGFTSKGGARDFMAESQVPVEPPFFSSGGGREYVPSSQELAEYEKALQKYGRATTMPEPPKSLQFEGPTQPAREVPPEEWFDYLNKTEGAGQEAQRLGLPAGEIPPGPVTIPENAPQRIDPTRAQLESFNRKAERVAQNQAEMVPPRKPEPATFEGPDRPPEFQPGPEQKFTMEGPDRPPEFQPGPEQKFTMEGPEQAPTMTMGEPPAGVSTGEVPFSTALADRRYLDRNINHTGRGGYEGAPMQEQTRRKVANQLRGQIDEGLDAAVGRKQLDSDVVDEWKTAKKQYGTAAAVEDPALAMMQKEYGGGMGLKDMAGAGMMSAFGVPGPAALATSQGMKGRWPGFKANQAERAAQTAAGIEGAANAVKSVPGAATARAIHPVKAALEENPDAPKADIIHNANNSLKESLQEAIKEGTDWFKHLWQPPNAS